MNFDALLHSWLAPDSLFQLVIVGILVWLILKGRVSSVGKNGVIFSTGAFELEIRQFMEKSDEADKMLMDGLKKAYAAIEESLEDRCKLNASVDTLRLESVKTQILLSETSLERKLNLYDQYKKLGGNGWIDIYINEQKAKHGAK